MTPASIPLRVIQGTTLNKVLRLMQPGRVYKEISAIAAAAPVLITVPGHGLPGTWPVWFRGVAGLNGINREPDSTRPWMAEVVDVDTLRINAIDATGQKGQGGRLIYLPPVDLTGVIGRLQVRAAVGSSEVLLELNTTNGGLVIDGLGLLRIHLSATQSAALAWKSGVYDLELTFSDGTVTRFAEGDVVVSQEVTR